MYGFGLNVELTFIIVYFYTIHECVIENYEKLSKDQLST